MDETFWYDYTWPEDTHTYLYASVVDFYYGKKPDGALGGVFIGTSAHWPDSLFWSHTLPAGLLVPPCVIFRARLWIDGKAVNTGNNTVVIQGVHGWEPLDHSVHDNATYDLTEVSEPGFWDQGSISVMVRAGESLVRLDEAKLLLDYDCPTSAEEEESLSPTAGFCLWQNHPNPFNPETEISFSLSEAAYVSLVVYNIFGQKVRGLVNVSLPAGSYAVTWDGTDNEGDALASGVYFCRLCAGRNASTLKMVLMK